MHLDVDVNLLNGVLTSGETVMELFASIVAVSTLRDCDSTLYISKLPFTGASYKTKVKTKFNLRK